MKSIFAKFELIAWIIALIGLSFYIPGDGHFTLCPLNNLGFDFCPGCGLGRSISYALHGELLLSLKMHPLGIFGLIIIMQRIIKLIYFHYFTLTFKQ